MGLNLAGAQSDPADTDEAAGGGGRTRAGRVGEDGGRYAGRRDFSGEEGEGGEEGGGEEGEGKRVTLALSHVGELDTGEREGRRGDRRRSGRKTDCRC